MSKTSNLRDHSRLAENESIDELAQRVLFSDQLDEKLKPLPLNEERPGEPPKRIILSANLTPARSGTIQFASGSESRPKLPASAHLVTEENRGTLLHFFANHELLAAELMALALLRFPDAPHKFRVGLANTLREEQRHTRWYLARMKECGVTFGEFPLSPFFWDAVSSMESPIDYVSRLSLTFEQANLDYAKYYSGVLGEAGDSKSASILNRIYEDEISHVGYGLHWFRQWKEESESDWEALKSNLHFPLSPSRAKGNKTGFNVEGRRLAGFDDDYIHQLSLFERSNGRTPNVFLFNPEAENSVAVHPAPHHPDKRILSVIEDLEIVTAILARRDDVILMRRPPSLEHRATLTGLGIQLPEIEELDAEGLLAPGSLVRERRLNDLRPWGLTPEVAKNFAALKANTSNDSPAYDWNDSRRALFSKSEQVKALREWAGTSFVCSAAEELSEAIEQLIELGYREAIVKRPFSTAGGGMRRIDLLETSRGNAPVFNAKILHEGGLLLEPSHRRELDFSVQYQMKDGRLTQLGLIRQIIADSGQYRGSISVNKFCQGMTPEISKFLMQDAFLNYGDDAPFTLALAAWLKRLDYEGPVGVDAYLHRQADGELALRTFCEVNSRYTMGRVTHELRGKVAPGHAVKFELLKREAGVAYENAVSLNQRGRIESGTLFLNEIHAGTRFVIKITIAKLAADL
ncbi:MAG: DUF455 family protein [Verrucomicrobiales bacterium]|nr:DUF455 family protein [Verrucomicrobiales bacterium]